ncbi:MAG: hypothetical protein COB04_02695 [Gammaproteobacteria bacterium]|nr:MAG: hypothetical protein COB04_02695 [Gammaproteobacteria bacterium]
MPRDNGTPKIIGLAGKIDTSETTIYHRHPSQQPPPQTRLIHSFTRMALHGYTFYHLNQVTAGATLQQAQRQEIIQPKPQSPALLENLTPLRGIGSIFVLIFHLKFQFPAFNEFILVHTHFFHRTYVWVDFFFILSGFVINHVYGTNFDKGITLRKCRTFIVSRFARIYPLHLVTLAAVVGLFYVNIWFFPSPVTYSFYPNNPTWASVLLVHSLNLYNSLSWNIVSWSISTEWVAYLIYPALFVALLRCSTRYILIPISLCIATYAVLAHHYGDLNITYQNGIFRCLAGFILGICMHRLFQKEFLFTVINGSVFIAIILLTCWLIHIPQAWTLDVLATLSSAMLVYVAAVYSGRASIVINNRFTRYIGDMSYSIYMWHNFFILVLMMIFFEEGERLRFGRDLTLYECYFYITLFIVFMIGFSSFSYQYIEKPLRRVAKRLFN